MAGRSSPMWLEAWASLPASMQEALRKVGAQNPGVVASLDEEELSAFIEQLVDARVSAKHLADWVAHLLALQAIAKAVPAEMDSLHIATATIVEFVANRVEVARKKRKCDEQRLEEVMSMRLRNGQGD